MLKRLLVLSLLLFSGSIYGAGMDISLGNESAQFVYLTDSGSLGYGGADVGFGFLYNEDSDTALTAGIMVVGNLGERKDLALGVGAKAYIINLDDEDDDAAALAIGGEFRYIIPSGTPVGFIANIHFAPGITAFGDTEDLRELNFRVELEVLPSTRGYIGYRKLEVETEDAGEVEVDDSMHIGVRLQF